MIPTYDSACMSQLAVHAFMECNVTYQRLKAFLFPTFSNCTNNLKQIHKESRLFGSRCFVMISHKSPVFLEVVNLTMPKNLLTSLLSKASPKQTKLTSVNAMPHQ